MGIDIAKNVFQIHGVDSQGKITLRKRIKRQGLLKELANIRPCLIGMEACASSHYWARAISSLGHDVKLMAAQFVCPYRKNEKNDGNDAEAICEAVSRPNMRFVNIKTVEQQAILTVHRARSLLVEERTALVNQIRGLLGEHGIVVACGIDKLRRALPAILEDAENELCDLVRTVIGEQWERLKLFDQRISGYDQQIQALANSNQAAKRLCEIEGIGAITATAIVASIGDGKTFNNGRQLAAWLGLVPRQRSSGNKNRLGRITKRGDVYLRTLLIHGSRSVLRVTAKRTDRKSRWVEELKARRGYNKAAVALAAKQARVIWAMLSRGEAYRVAA